VLDLAAGTGKLTGVLCAEGHQVTAVEPDEAMLSELVRLHGGVRALPGTAERIPLPDGTVDAVVAGQAFHWFDYERAMTEIARVLRPGGVVAGLWNGDDLNVGWVAEFGEVSKSPVSAKDFLATHVMPDHPMFTAAEEAEFTHSQRRTAESLVATVNTHSHLLVATPDDQRETTERMLAFLRGRPETATGEFDFPMRTYVKRLVRR
jgi:SAM-dependent methyltransferase